MAEAGSTEKQPSTLGRWTPSIPSNLMGMLNPFSNDDDKSYAETNTSSHQSNKRASFLSGFLPSPSPAGSPSPNKDDDSEFFAEPVTRTNSDDESRVDSVDESERRKSKKRNRPQTCYSICHPAPSSTTRQKLHRRTRPLLQLHKLSPNARPKPAFDVIPSANFSMKLTRAITKVFKTKHGLCTNDLVVLRAEKYSGLEPDEEQEARDIIALICKGRKEDNTAPGKAKICLPDGREWEAYPMLNGGYEFFSTDEHGLGLTVRWVPKKTKDGNKPAEDDGKKKFNFSTISPNSRKHPVIATLSKTELDVNDTYKMPNASAATPLSTPRQDATALDEEMEEEETGGKEYCETDDRLRQIIVMTGIWVAFKEGWSPNFKYDDKEKESNGLGIQRSPSLHHSPPKSATFSPTVATPPASPVVTSPLEKRNSFGLFRTGSLLNKANRKSTTSVPEGPEEQPEPAKKSGRARADSASTVLVHRAASNRTKNRQQATWRPDLVAAQQDMREDSHEELARSQSTPLISSPNAFEGSTSPTPRRQDSVAKRILPSAREGGSNVDDSKDTNAPRKTSDAQKRNSTATTNTTTSSAASPRKPQSTKQPKKRGGLRRLLCGANDV